MAWRHDPKSYKELADRPGHHAIDIKGQKGVWHVNDEGKFCLWIDGHDTIYIAETLEGAKAKVKRHSVKVEVPYSEVEWRDVKTKEPIHYRSSGDGPQEPFLEKYVATGLHAENRNLLVKCLRDGKTSQESGYNNSGKLLPMTPEEETEILKLHRVKNEIERRISAFYAKHSYGSEMRDSLKLVVEKAIAAKSGASSPEAGT